LAPASARSASVSRHEAATRSRAMGPFASRSSVSGSASGPRSDPEARPAGDPMGTRARTAGPVTDSARGTMCGRS
jgi:hypothetical protein